MFRSLLILVGGVISVALAGQVQACRRRTKAALVESDRLREQLETANRRLEAILEQMPVGVVLAEAPDGRIIRHNAELSRILGHPAHPIADIAEYSRKIVALHRDSRPYAAEDWPLARSLSTGEVVNDEEIEILRSDGSWMTARISSAPIRDRDGAIVAGVAALFDITARKRAERSLHLIADLSHILAERVSQESLEALAERVARALGDGCAIFLRSAVRGHLELAALSHAGFGVTAQGRALVSDDLLQADDTFLTTVLASGTPLLLSVDNRTETSKQLDEPGPPAFLDHFQASQAVFVPMRLHDQPVGVLSLWRSTSGQPFTGDEQALFQDLADRLAVAVENARLYEQELRAREEAERTANLTARLQAVTAALSEALSRAEVASVVLEHGVAALDAIRAIVVVHSGSYLELLVSSGYPPEFLNQWQVISINASIPLAECVRRGEAILIGSIEELAQMYPDLVPLNRQLGSHATASIPMIVNGQAIGALGFTFSGVRSFTPEHKDFMLALGRQCAQALERARLFDETREAIRARDEFLSIAAHELKTPVTSIKGYAQLMLRNLGKDNADPERLTRALSAIDAASGRLTVLVHDLLDVARIRTGQLPYQPAALDLVALIRDVVQRHQLPAESGHAFQLDLPSEPLPAMVDAARIEQVIVNLLDNAAKYSPHAARIDVRLVPDETGATIAVRDWGIGLPPGMSETVFKPFGRAPNAARDQIAGMGLGLFICRSIVERHGGRIWVESEGEDKGTTVSFWLPRSLADRGEA